jgi:hypothetical protein
VASIRERSYCFAAMPFKPRKVSLLILGATAVACSQAVFAFFGDPEGPNLVVVGGLAAFIYLVCLAFYLSGAVRTLTRLSRLLVAIFIQIIVAFGFYVVLR